jgi:hypothetical protein
MTDRQKVEAIRSLMVGEFLTDDEIRMFQGIRETEARCKARPVIAPGILDEFNAFLADVHAYSHENGYRWAAHTKAQLVKLLAELKAEYYSREV